MFYSVTTGSRAKELTSIVICGGEYDLIDISKRK
jgi:hypothetical protein